MTHSDHGLHPFRNTSNGGSITQCCYIYSWCYTLDRIGRQFLASTLKNFLRFVYVKTLFGMEDRNTGTNAYKSWNRIIYEAVTSLKTPLGTGEIDPHKSVRTKTTKSSFPHFNSFWKKNSWDNFHLSRWCNSLWEEWLISLDLICASKISFSPAPVHMHK